MQDDLDQMLEGQDQQSPVGSQPQNDDGSNPDDTGGQTTEEEAEFSKLTGASQDRFRQLYREKQAAIAERDRLRQVVVEPNQTQNGQQLAPTVKEAVDKLRAVGVTTKDDVKQLISEVMSQQTYYTELDKLEGTLNGNDGRPKFTREEYWDYTEKHPQFKNYLPMDVYEKMYKEELSDWTAKSGTQTQVRRPSVLRPTRSQQTQTEMSAEDVEAKLASLPQDQRGPWLDANRSKVDRALRRTATE